MRITDTISLIIILCLLSCTANRDSRLYPENWTTAFTAVNPAEATVFELNNEHGLKLPDGASRFHQQGIQRLAGGGWAVSGSDMETGYLYFADGAGRIHTQFTVPTDLDLEGEAASLKYNHPGGFQITDNILAIGIENTDLRMASYSRVVLLDITDPKAPKHLSHLDIIREAEAGSVMSAGAVGITALKDAYLIVVGNWDSKRFDFYRTSSKDLHDPTTTISERLGSWTPGAAGHSYQNFNIYGDDAGALYAIGLYSIDRSRDWADLILLDAADLTDIRLEEIYAVEYRGGFEGAKFVHAGGTYRDPASSRFIVFSVEAHLHGGVVRGNIW